MKKSILGIAVLVCAFIGFSASAQTTDCQKKECQKKECVKGKDDCKRHKDHHNPFEGLNLTDAQKEQIKALRENKECTNRQECLGKIKEILTPEQYTKFLENKLAAKNHKGMKHDKGKMHHGKKGPKCDAAKCEKAQDK